MSSAHWPRYPPCASGACADSPCCGLGKIQVQVACTSGKEGRGSKSHNSKGQSRCDCYDTPGRVGSPDFCCNRVQIVSNPQGNVLQVPSVG